MLIVGLTGRFPFEYQSALAAVGFLTSIGAYFFFWFNILPSLLPTSHHIPIAITVIMYVLAVVSIAVSLIFSPAGF